MVALPGETSKGNIYYPGSVKRLCGVGLKVSSGRTHPIAVYWYCTSIYLIGQEMIGGGAWKPSLALSEELQMVFVTSPQEPGQADLPVKTSGGLKIGQGYISLVFWILS